MPPACVLGYRYGCSVCIRHSSSSYVREICYLPVRVTNRRFFHAFLLFISKSIAPIFVRWKRAGSSAPASISSLVYLPKFPLRLDQYSPKRKQTYIASMRCCRHGALFRFNRRPRAAFFNLLTPTTVSKSSTATHAYVDSFSRRISNISPPNRVRKSVSTENDGNCFPFFLKSLPFLFLSFRRDAFLLWSMDAWIRSGRRF
jgi:hypothetical protein